VDAGAGSVVAVTLPPYEPPALTSRSGQNPKVFTTGADTDGTGTVIEVVASGTSRNGTAHKCGFPGGPSALHDVESMASLSERLHVLCTDALTRLVDGPGRAMVEQIATKVASPLTVTVAGGVSSGKSTLVNALLGQQIAAVDAGECTKVVTEFRYGSHERVEVVGHDGSISVLPLRRGEMPTDLGRPSAEITSVVVHLSNAVLKKLSVVDTPGLNTVTEVNEATTADFLGIAGREGQQTAQAVGRADALVFLLPVLRQSDAEVLRGFSRLFGGSNLSSASAVAVLSKIDRLNRVDRLQSGADPLTSASPIAVRMASELKGVVSNVVPVIGLLAETSQAAVFTEADARSLLRVAAVDDQFDREDMLLSGEDFLRFGGLDLAEEQRARLLSLLDLYGLTVALRAADHGAKTASTFLRSFDEASGFGALRSAVVDRFTSQSEVFKAHAAIHDLRRASYLRNDPDNAKALRALRAPLEQIELDPSFHQLRVLEVARAVAAGELVLPPVLAADVDSLTRTADPASALGAIASEAGTVSAAGASRWLTWMNDPRRSPDEVRYGRAVKEAFELLWNTFDGTSHG
jgi:hypothetical protein